jgi:hypothetical protein
VCETAAHLWLQQLPFVVVQMQLLPAPASAGEGQADGSRPHNDHRPRVAAVAKTEARELMVNMRSRGTLATTRSNICTMDGATALYAALSDVISRDAFWRATQ